jgi:hypothetical protein
LAYPSRFRANRCARIFSKKIQECRSQPSALERVTDRPNKPLSVVPTPTKTEGATGVAERRRTPRYPFTVAVEVTESRSQTRVACRTADIGMGGCYVDTMAPFPVGAIVHVRLSRESRQVDAKARVVVAHPSMGMGLAFTEINPEHVGALRAWVAEASGEGSAEPEAAPAEPEAGMSTEILKLRQVLNELVSLLVRNRIIKEQEGAALLRHLFR